MRIKKSRRLDRYNAVKSKSISRLSFYIYDLNNNLDPIAHLKSGTHIRVQTIPARKKRKTGKKAQSGQEYI
ncbi:1082_t:CDS:2 [Gigaspora rosea]|nr:1082_t:CDS:2 [Gigaspora rosea]